MSNTKIDERRELAVKTLILGQEITVGYYESANSAFARRRRSLTKENEAAAVLADQVRSELGFKTVEEFLAWLDPLVIQPFDNLDKVLERVEQARSQQARKEKEDTIT